jgi:hypothetical protein
MSFFDTDWRFHTTENGRRLFFPWGGRGSGYVVASEQDYARLRKQIKISNIVTFIVVLLVTFALG